MMKRICLLLAALALVASASDLHAGSKPNILILFADDLGYGDLSIHGHPTIHTPNIDRLANEGIRFTQFYSAFHVCSPSRASMLTGRLPVRSGMTGAGWLGGVLGSDARGGLPLNETTFAEALRPVGYKTAAVGKWHLGQQKQFLPTNRGFDSYFGIPYSVDMGSSAWDYYNSPDRPPLPLLRDTTILEQPANLNRLTGRYADYAVEFIKNTTATQTPFLLYMAFNHVHGILQF